MNQIVVTKQPYARAFIWLMVLCAPYGFYQVMRTHFHFQPSDWTHWQGISLIAGGAGLLGWIIVKELRQKSYFIVLQEKALGITENGRQRIIPLASITKVAHFKVDLHGAVQHVLKMNYQYQGSIETMTITQITFLGMSMKLSNFETFVHELKRRKDQIPAQRWSEATEAHAI